MTNIKKRSVGRPKQENTASKLLQVRVTPFQYKEYSSVANKEGLSVSAWVKHLLNSSCNIQTFDLILGSNSDLDSLDEILADEVRIESIQPMTIEDGGHRLRVTTTMSEEEIKAVISPLCSELIINNLN